jgi:rod shape-determining protein MreC
VDSPLFPSDYSPVNTRVISWASEFDQQVVIAAGSDHLIREETPVVTRDGLVGSVTQVAGSSALVTLLTDENSAVQARDQKTDAIGLVRHGQGEGTLILDRVTKDRNVEEGDIIVTAGTRSRQYPSLFPRGIPIGIVTSVGQSDTAPYKQIQIHPFVDFSALDAVTALITHKRIPKAP